MGELSVGAELGVIPHPVRSVLHEVLDRLGIGQDLFYLLGVLLHVYGNENVHGLAPLILREWFFLARSQTELRLTVLCGEVQCVICGPL